MASVNGDSVTQHHQTTSKPSTPRLGAAAIAAATASPGTAPSKCRTPPPYPREKFTRHEQIMNRYRGFTTPSSMMARSRSLSRAQHSGGDPGVITLTTPYPGINIRTPPATYTPPTIVDVTCSPVHAPEPQVVDIPRSVQGQNESITPLDLNKPSIPQIMVPTMGLGLGLQAPMMHPSAMPQVQDVFAASSSGSVQQEVPQHVQQHYYNPQHHLPLLHTGGMPLPEAMQMMNQGSNGGASRIVGAYPPPAVQTSGCRTLKSSLTTADTGSNSDLPLRPRPQRVSTVDVTADGSGLTAVGIHHHPHGHERKPSRGRQEVRVPGGSSRGRGGGGGKTASGRVTRREGPLSPRSFGGWPRRPSWVDAASAGSPVGEGVKV